MDADNPPDEVGSRRGFLARRRRANHLGHETLCLIVFARFRKYVRMNISCLSRFKLGGPADAAIIPQLTPS